ncbi:MAG TPA: serine hydrolase [Nonomuraea sp.]|nr:serine hydrolase [Nonomuraea sp.]
MRGFLVAGRGRLAALGLAVATGLSALTLPAAPAQGATASCAHTRAPAYPRAAAAAVGLDPAALEAAVTYWVNEGAENLKVFRHGCLIAEGALDPATDRIERQNWSQTKTVSALIAGVAVRQGILGVDDPIGRHLPPNIGDDAHRAITIRQVLTMTSGIELRRFANTTLNADLSGPRDTMSFRIRHEPGTYFEYDQHAASLLNWSVEEALRRSGRAQDYLEFAQREFFGPLGIPASAYWWQRDHTGTPTTHSNLFLRPLDFGRIGELLRGQGAFDGVRVVNADYLRLLTTGTSANCGYGFMVWLNSCAGDRRQVNASIITRREISPARPWIATAPADMYYSWGAKGQHIFVIPSLDLVITRSGERSPDNSSDTAHLSGNMVWNGAQKAGYEEFFRLLMRAVTP